MDGWPAQSPAMTAGKRGEVEDGEVAASAAASSSGSKSRKETPSRGVARISFRV